MKKLLLIGTAILFAMTVNAQIPLTRELTCTEEAFNFRLSVGSSLHFGTPHMGPDGLPKSQPNWQSPLTTVQDVPDYQPFFWKDEAPVQHSFYNFRPATLFKPAINYSYTNTGNTYMKPVIYKPGRLLQ